MNFLIIVRVALRSLRRTLLRSSLTALGIIIGVAAVIALVSVGNGAKAQIESSLAGLDTNQLRISARTARDDWQYGRRQPLPPGDGLTVEDYREIRTGIRGVAFASLDALARADELEANGRSSDATVTGIDIEGIDIASRKVVRGTRFGASDVERIASVCLISSFIAQNLFPGRDPLGRVVRIAEVPFVVIGMLADDDSTRRTGRPQAGDTTVYIPYTSLLRRLDRNAQLSITLRASDPHELVRMQREVSDLLERRRGKRKAEFVTGNLEETVRRYREGSETMTLLLAAIAGISLLVGGIGIMNIMLVSVSERTREIGIRLAIGTRGRDVLRQFLIEAVILSVLGGLIGIVLGVGSARLITSLNGLPTQVTPSSIAGAFLCSALIGIFFGWYPARQAAQLDPIEALRAD